MSVQIFGVPVAKGVAIGRAVLVASSRVDVEHYFIDPSRVEEEVTRLRTAANQVVKELTDLRDELPEDAPAELSAMLDVHCMLLEDDTLRQATRQWISERHYNAEWALSAQLEVVARQFDEIEDDYLRERKADLEQVVEKVLRVMARDRSPAEEGTGDLTHASRDFAGEDPLILVAADISPADMLQFQRSVFTGFVTDVGGKTSHTAIVARSLNIPAVVGARVASALVAQDDWVIVDGDAGVVIVDPSPMVLEEYRFRQRQIELERARLARLRHTPAVTLDGLQVDLQANIELPRDALKVLDAGATGIGLFRTEFLFMNRGDDMPGEDEQYEAYRATVQAMQGRPVTIRTIDIGSDKPLDRMTVNELRHQHVLNPAMGLRAIRWSLTEPDLFRVQLRAILRASVHGPVRILVPMIGQLSEARATHKAMRKARAELESEGVVLGHVPLGAMVEVPAAVFILPHLLNIFDFSSIGTNDLIQYALAIDRADESVAHLFDPWHPAVLQMMATTARVSKAMGKPVSVCGELAGDTQFTDVLLGLGLTQLSMHPSQVATVKQQVLRINAGQWAGRMEELLSVPDPLAKVIQWREWLS